MNAPLPATVLLALGCAVTAWTADIVPLHPAPAGTATPRIAASSTDVALTRDGDALTLAVTPRQDAWPGISLVPTAGPWDLSRCGRVEAEVENTGVREVVLGIRVDHGGQDGTPAVFNWCTTPIPPGETRTVAVWFGWDGGNPAKQAVDARRVSQIIIYSGRPDYAIAYTVKRIVAAGSPGDQPTGTTTAPVPGGIILGPGCAIDAARELRGTAGGTAAMAPDGLPRLTTGTATGAGLSLLPKRGCWNLRDHLQVSATVRNLGRAPASPRLRVSSVAGQTAWAAAGAPVPPGRSATLTASFIPPQPWTGAGGQPGLPFASDAVTSIDLIGGGDALLAIESVVAGLPPRQPPPEWLGRRPPVAGDWVQTLAEEFDGTAVDSSRWSIYTENYWDKVSHFTKDNVIVGGGTARLRYEVRRGHHNDDAARHQTDHACGVLISQGRWTQCYGYFEARMRTPKALGLWPAFWMMPDRGAGVPQAERYTTRDRGMEFDIFEHLVRYGPHRYNIALHWDDYEKDHRMVASESMYAQPDAEGFVVAGLLWEPGRASWYANGRLMASWTDARVASVPSYLLFTMPSGGWGGNVLDAAALPDEFTIDWVRAWQLRERLPKAP